MSIAGATRSLLLMGRCAPSIKKNASKIVVKKLEFDQNLLMVSENIEISSEILCYSLYLILYLIIVL